MFTRELTIEKDDTIISIGVKTQESFNFHSGMEACLNSIVYLKVNGIQVDNSELFGLVTLDELTALTDV
jgi:hypothetical protein